MFNPNLLVAFILAFFVLSGLALFEDLLKRLMGLDVSFKFLWYHRSFTILLYLLVWSFVLDPKDTINFLISIFSEIKTWRIWRNWIEIFSQIWRILWKIWKK